MNKYNTMDIITALNMIENTPAQRKLITVDSTIDQIFFNTFGMDWYKIKFFKDLRENVLQLMELKENTYTKDYYNLISK